MNEVLEFLTSEEMIIVGVIATIGVVLSIMVYIFERNHYKRKIKQNTKELKNLVEEEDNEIKLPQLEEKPLVIPIEEIKKEPVVPIEEVKKEPAVLIEEVKEKQEVIQKEDKKVVQEETKIPTVSEIYQEVKEEVETLEELAYTDIEPNKEEAKEELRKVTENLMKKEAKEDSIELTKFEEEQEENAIISIEELMKKGDELYEQNEVTQYVDEGNEPISIQDLEDRMKNIKEEIEKIEEKDSKDESLIVENLDSNPSLKVVMNDFETIETNTKDHLYRDDVIFKSSPIISPIFGIEEKNANTNDITLENTANYEKLDEEIRKTNEFIVTLKELQKKLD